jgi:predicted RNA-binding protein (virulence factor B family)
MGWNPVENRREERKTEMKFEEILKASEVDDEKASAILAAMKENKVFLSSEEDIDTRYGKLKGQHEQAVGELGEAQALIKQLQEATASNEDAQAQIADYEKRITQLESEKTEAEVRAAIRVAAAEHGAKDAEYIIWKLEQSGGKLEVDETGRLKGAEDLMKDIKATSPEQFKSEATIEIDVAKLKTGDPRAAEKTAKDFTKMSYMERLELKQSKPELYNKLSEKKE